MRFGMSSFSSLFLWQGAVFGTVRISTASATKNNVSRKLTLLQPLQRRAAPCDELEYIIGDYGTIEGTLQGAMILLPMSGTEAGDVTRKFLALLDDATLNIHALYDLIPTCSPPGGYVVKVRDNAFSHSSLTLKILKLKQRQSLAICRALTQVSADVAQTAALMTKLARAKDLPKRMYMEPLQEAADDATSKIAIVEAALKATNGCVKS